MKKAGEPILRYKEYIHKYVRLLGGMPPDTSIDTTLFIRQLESGQIDIPGMLDYCSSRNISLDLENIMKKILYDHMNERKILRKFRTELIIWLKRKLEINRR